MNLASTLLRTIIAESDIETWASCHKHFFSSEYSSMWECLHRFVDEHSRLPTFQDLRLSVRDATLQNKFNAIESMEDVDIDASILLEYLKNEFAQIELMSGVEGWLTESVAIDSAQESLDHLQELIIDVEERLDLKDPSTDMRRMELFEPQDILDRYIPLGLNNDFDRLETYGPTEYVLIGGKRGQGKSLTCANIATNVYEAGDSVIYFTIEMTPRSMMQRCCAIATGVPVGAMRKRNLSILEWEKVAQWWSTRYEDGERAFSRYLSHRDFDKYHTELSSKPLREKQLDIVYGPSLTLANIRTELDKKINKLDPKVVIVDYINQVKRSSFVNSRAGQYDWTEQVEISKALKSFAQEYEVLMVSPYQIDATGEARFAKAILDSADAAFTLDAHSKKDNIITFNCTKMRNSGDEVSFTSVMDWASLRIGPETGQLPKEDSDDDSSDELVFDL